MAAKLPPLKCWGARYPDEGQTVADAPAGYINLIWDFFYAGNFRLPATKFFLEILEYYKFHISQMHPIGMVRVRHFEFVCRTMHIEPTVPRFRVFHQIHCSQGFYSFVQRSSAKKILLQPPKSFHDWKHKLFFIKVGVIPIRMTFRGKADVPTETIQTPVDENCMSLNWWMNREDKPVYMEGDKIVSLYVVAFERKGGKMATVAKKPDEELYHFLRFIVGELSNLGIGPEKKRRAPTTTAAPKKNDAGKAQHSKGKNVGGEKKGTRRSFDSCCDYVVVSDSLEDLAPIVIKRPKLEQKDVADIPPSNPDDPIDVESSPEHLLRKKTGKRKQDDTEAEGQPEKKVRRKKITRRGNLDAFMLNPVFKKPNSPVHTEPSSVVNEDLSPSPPCASVNEQLRDVDVPNEAEKTAGAEDSGFENPLNIVVDAGKVTSPGVVDVGAGNPQTPEVVAQDSEKGKSAQAIPNVSAKDHGSFSDADKNYPIRPDETLGDYNYRTYLEKNASKIHVPIWNLKKGDTFSDWRVCRDWLQGTFPPGEIKFQEGRLHDQTYHAYLEEAASYTSTTHRIMRGWYSMHKEWAAFKASKKKAAKDENCAAQLKAKLEADQDKFGNDRRTEEWSVVGWKRKAEAEDALLSEERKTGKRSAEVERLKKQDAEIEKLKKEKDDVESARDEARSHREKSEQREVHTCATLALRDKEIEELISLLSEQEQLKKDLELTHTEKAETSRRLTETEEKLENSEIARATAEIELVPLKSDMTWLKEHGIASVAESVLNSEELDNMVVRLVVSARNDGYAQGYVECSHHVVNALKVDWDTSKSATHGVNTDAALAAMKTECNNLQLSVMDLINVALQSEDHVAQLKEIFLDGENEDEDLA
ncbi:hypothetical protein Hanom_Chr01g00051481 [Helianthus anomalus]